jgi:pimeloyl-ACP methyl ester carboxylesterase
LRAVIGYIAGGIAAVLAAGAAYQALGVRRDRRRFPPLGKYADLGSHRLHFQDTGSGSPAIVLESGLMSTILTWPEIQAELAKSTRVISYDRAGLGWSDSGPLPRTAERIVAELRSLLDRTRAAPPYILVGHSFGGLTMQLFAARYPTEVAGVVLVDPVAPAEWHPPSEHDRHRAELGSKILRRASWLAHTGLIRFISALIHSGAKSAANRIIRSISRGAPAESNNTESSLYWNLPARERAMATVFWTQAKFCRTIASQLGMLSESAAQVIAAGRIEKPVTVISAGTSSPQRLASHKAIAAQSPRGRHILADRSDHWITESQPELVVGAILEMVSAPPARNPAHTLSPSRESGS